MKYQQAGLLKVGDIVYSKKSVDPLTIVEIQFLGNWPDLGQKRVLVTIEDQGGRTFNLYHYEILRIPKLPGKRDRFQTPMDR